MIPTIRLHSQQLINPVFNNPKDLVSWMGGIQAQDYTMSKWAIGIRLKAGNLLPSPEDKTFQLTFTTKQTDYWKRH